MEGKVSKFVRVKCQFI